MPNSNGQNQYPGYGQAPPGYGGYPQMPNQQPGSSPYPMAPNPAHPSRPTHAASPPRRGSSSSRALPIIVAGGLAIGVFGGLMIVRGTGSAQGGGPTARDASAQAANLQDAGAVATATVDAAPAAPVDAAVAVVKPVDAAPARPAMRKVAIEFDVQPQDAEVTVDGTVVSGNRYEIELAKGGSVKVKIRASAEGFYTKNLSQTIDKDTAVRIRLGRKRSGGDTTRRDPDRLIDL